MNNILVTGGGGFLGTSLCKQLVELGHKVFSLSRSHYSHLNELGVEQISADITDVDCLESVFSDFNFDVIFHVAAKAGVWGAPKDFYNINFLGTKNLVEMAKKNKIRKFIYTSTPSVAFGNTPLEGADESIPYPEKYYCEYAKTKSMGEQLVLANSSEDFQVCALRPHLIWGNGDPHILPRLCEKAKDNKLKIIGSGLNKVDIIYVDNAARAHVLAMQKLGPKSVVNGSAYFLGQKEPVKLWSFINSMLESKDLKPVEKNISFSLAYKLGAIFEVIYNMFSIYKKDPPMTRFVAMQMGMSHYFSHEKSLSDLGDYQLISTLDGLKKL
jgi:nucleoside-diphosphate-sugar epimerase